MTAADLVILVVLLASGVLAMVRGFTSELMSIIAFVLAALIALLAQPYIHPLVEGHLPKGFLGVAITLAGLFLVALVPLWFIGDRLSGQVRRSAIGAFDRTFGFAFGVLRGLFILAIAYLVFTGFAGSRGNQPDWIKEAMLMPLVEKTAELLLALAPEDSDLAAPFKDSYFLGDGRTHEG